MSSAAVIAAVMTEQPPPGAWWVLMITTAGGIVTQVVMAILKSRDEIRKEEQRHRFALEDARFKAQVTAQLEGNTAQLQHLNRRHDDPPQGGPPA